LFYRKITKKRVEIQKDRAEKSRLLNAVRNEKLTHLAALKELENASAQLQALIDRLEKDIRAKAREEIYSPPGKGGRRGLP
jgi:septal ring factor EnvC (AmiA/AmiB activator)